MAIDYDKYSTVLDEDTYDTNPSKTLLNSPLWSGVDVANQTVNPNNVDVMGNVDYPENIYGKDFSGLPQMGGGIIGGFKGAQKGFQMSPPGIAKPIGTLIGGAVGAFTGGTAGDAAKQGFYSITGNTNAPDSWEQAINSAVGAGAEEALYDVLGQGIVGAIRGTWRLMRGKPRYSGQTIQDTTQSGIGAYRSAADQTVLNQNEQYVPATVMINDLIKARGVQFTASQVTTSAAVSGIEALAAASWGGGAFTTAQGLTDRAITQYVDDYIAHFNGKGLELLDAEQLGTLFKMSIETGKAQHSAIGERMFKFVDDLYVEQFKTKTIKKTVPTGIADVSGNMINRVETSTIEEVIQPVNLKELKKYVQERIDKGKPVAGIPNGDWGGNLLDKILTIDDTVNFGSAQELRSFFLAESRSLESKFGEAKVKLMMGKMERLLDDALTKGAEDTGNDAFIQAYRKANAFWKEGAQTVKSKNIADLINRDPEFIGAKLFKDGNVTIIKEARIALNNAAKYSKGTVDEFNANDVYSKMQSGYLESLIAGARDDAATILSDVGTSRIADIAVNSKLVRPDSLIPNNIVGGDFKLTNLKKLLVKGTPANDTFKTAFTNKQQQSIKDFVNVLEGASRKNSAAGDFMMKVGQAGLVLDTFGLVNLPGVDINPETTLQFGTNLAAYTISPWVVGKLLTSPSNVRYLTRAMTMSPKSPQAGAVITKLLGAIGDIYNENPIEFQNNEGGQ